MWLKIYVLGLCAIWSVASVEITPDKSVMSAAVDMDLQVNCSSPKGVRWSSQPSTLLLNAQNARQSQVEGMVGPKGTDNISTLTISGVQKANQGKYTCTEEGTGATQDFELRVFNVVRKDLEFQYEDDVLLNCSVEDDGKNRSFSYHWLKGGVPVGDVKGETKTKFIEHENGSLEIKHPPRNFAGIYSCIAEYEEGGEKHTIITNINYYAEPKVIPFDKSKNLVQDERLVVECKVLGYPKPTIAWYKESELIEAGDGSRYKMTSAKTYDGAEIENGKLEVESVGFDDAAQYKCMATSDRWPEFNSTQVILVRVKDKLAALWPFLGIVAEVVFLCTVIFIYEKKRSKDAAAQEDANHDGASAEKKAEGVRHRGSPNSPRA